MWIIVSLRPQNQNRRPVGWCIPVLPLVDVRSDVTRNLARTHVEVTIVLRKHVDVVEDEAVEAASRARLHEAGIHRHRFVENVLRPML